MPYRAVSMRVCVPNHMSVNAFSKTKEHPTGEEDDVHAPVLCTVTHLSHSRVG